MGTKRETKIRAAYTRGFRQEARARGIKDAFATVPFYVLDDPGIGPAEAFTLGQADARAMGGA